VEQVLSLELDLFLLQVFDVNSPYLILHLANPVITERLWKLFFRFPANPPVQGIVVHSFDVEQVVIDFEIFGPLKMLCVKAVLIRNSVFLVDYPLNHLIVICVLFKQVIQICLITLVRFEYRQFRDQPHIRILLVVKF
jgi:hypothetical protein